MLYVLGRSLGILIFQVAALIPVLAGTLLAMRGWSALRALSFMLLFIVYLVPLPAYVQDSMTLPLSQTVAAIVDYVLYAAAIQLLTKALRCTSGSTNCESRTLAPALIQCSAFQPLACCTCT